MTFIVKELFEFCTATTCTGTPYYKLKSIVNDISDIREKIAYVKKYLRL